MFSQVLISSSFVFQDYENNFEAQMLYEKYLSQLSDNTYNNKKEFI